MPTIICIVYDVSGGSKRRLHFTWLLRRALLLPVMMRRGELNSSMRLQDEGSAGLIHPPCSFATITPAPQE